MYGAFVSRCFRFSYHVSVYMRYSRSTCVFFHQCCKTLEMFLNLMKLCVMMGSRSADAHRNPGTTHGISTSTSNVSIGNGTVTVKVRAFRLTPKTSALSRTNTMIGHLSCACCLNPHFPFYEVVLVTRWVIPCKCRKTLEMLVQLMTLCGKWGEGISVPRPW